MEHNILLKKCVLPCILQDDSEKCERSFGHLGTSEVPIWEKKSPVAKAACRTILCTKSLCQEEGTQKEQVLDCCPLPYALWAIPSHYWCFINSLIFFFFRRNSIWIAYIDTNHFLWLTTLNHHKKSSLLFDIFTSLLCEFSIHSCYRFECENNFTTWTFKYIYSTATRLHWFVLDIAGHTP